MNKYILKFKQLPTTLVYAFDETDDKFHLPTNCVIVYLNMLLQNERNLNALQRRG